MNLTEYLDAEWKPALGCTEPAAVAHAASLAAAQGTGEVRAVRLVVDPRTYKNCHAVGLPNSGGRTGILWALALGACLPDPSLGLGCFAGVDAGVLAAAAELLARKVIRVEVDPCRAELHIDCTVDREDGTGRAVLEVEHTHVARLEANGAVVGGAPARIGSEGAPSVRATVGTMGLQELRKVAATLSDEDRRRLREGAAFNLAMAEHGVSLLPAGFVPPPGSDLMTRLSRLVAAGVFARMSGVPLMVVSLAGSGNKGITVSVPVTLWGRAGGHPQARIDEALAFACLVTTATTQQLGTLSAVCGAANAAGIGIALAILLLEGANPGQMDLAVANMVGNVAGMICDGAKIGCAMKAMTGVDAAFRSATLALADFGIPATDGIVGVDGDASLANLGRLARQGMTGVDAEVLEIMQAKL
ncbi:L-serine ammonia-lyase, iron-sulfur-dependent, subunit alpha [Geothrix campi]|uniref:L-serine ammonia-lyase, iron-sulfur-dependent, subunit alpha n=1 Tax=Geothrix campi TaxID=2966450 RepID=UPI002147D468|nr:L-serine ammonia-lyase, iron-sulfur-dependent, subunit alpha [Geothrix sp. SG10]